VTSGSPARVVLITGASQGIGAATARAFGRAGSSVVLVARRAEALERVAEEVRSDQGVALALPADIALAGEHERLVTTCLDRFGRVDVLVNSAGLIHPKVDLVDMEPALWQRVIDVNLTGTALMMRAVLPTMISQRGGTIVNVSSIGGRRGAAGRSAYRATKAAQISLTESIAAEVRDHGIDVTCICPGAVDTEGYRDAFGQRSVKGRNLIEPEEIAALILFLASSAGTVLSGTVLDAFGDSNPLFR